MVTREHPAVDKNRIQMSNDLGFSRGTPSARLNGMETGPYLVSTYHVTSGKQEAEGVVIATLALHHS